MTIGSVGEVSDFKACPPADNLCQITKYKHPARRTAGKQIPNKCQMIISNGPNVFDILKFGHCDLFVARYLRFGIFHRPPSDLAIHFSCRLTPSAFVIYN
jgi:hypothetical protein